MEALQKIVDGLEENLGKISKETEDHEKKIEEKNAEIQRFISSITSNKEEKRSLTPDVTPMMGSSVAIFSMMVPFVESVMSYICKMVMATSHESMIKTLQGGLSELTRAQQRLKEQEWNIQNQLMDNQLKLAKIKIENGETLPCFLVNI